MPKGYYERIPGGTPVLFWCKSCHDVVEQKTAASGTFKCYKGHTNRAQTRKVWGDMNAHAHQVAKSIKWHGKDAILNMRTDPLDERSFASIIPQSDANVNASIRHESYI